jgi:S1-C subfamily serine protease
MSNILKKRILLFLIVFGFFASTAMVVIAICSSGPASGDVFFLNEDAQLTSSMTYATVIDGVKAAVVTLDVSGKGPQTGKPPDTMSFDVPLAGGSDSRIGCGLVIDPSGYILTNLHVVNGGTKIEVQIYRVRDKTYTARIVATDPAFDLALLKIDIPYPLPTCSLGNSDVIKVGDVVMAVGSPFGLEYSVTRGIISDDRRTITVEGHELADMIQCDAAINRGNCGGPLVNSNGVVVGINTAILTPSGVYVGTSFAVPINKAKKLLMKAKYSGV